MSSAFGDAQSSSADDDGNAGFACETRDVHDEQDAQDVELSKNVAADFVEGV